MSFIPMNQMKILREAAKNGDERAKKIIQEHFQKKDYSADLEDYFKPVQETAPEAPKESIPDMPATNPGTMPEHVGTGNPKLDEFLRGNGIKEGDEDYEDAINDYYMEFPNERPKDSPVSNVLETATASEAEDLTKDIAQKIIETIKSCDQFSVSLMESDNVDGTTMKGAMTSIGEIKTLLFDCADKVKKIKQSLCKKEGE